MNEPDLEQQLRAARLAAPSDQLDRRMEVLFSTDAPRPAATGWNRWGWLALSAAGAAAAFIFLMARHPLPPPPAPPVVYQFEPQGLLREFLLTPPAASQTPPAMIVTVRAYDSLPNLP